jgi:hypothetical protein
MTLLLLLACTTMDGFFFNPMPLDAYALDFDEVPPGQVELVSFEGSDGETLYGVWARQEQGNADHPTVLYFHGNKWHIDEYVPKVEALWRLGFDVFTFDYRGFGMSTGTPTHDGVLQDSRDAVALVTETTGLPTTDLAYVGLSLGGFASVHVASELPPRSLVTEDMFARGDLLVDDGAGGIDLPPGWLIDDAWDNAAAASRVTVPYLVVHGAEDDFIRPEHAELIFEAANEPKELWLVPGADHAEAPDVAPEAYAERIRCWAVQDCAER